VKWVKSAFWPILLLTVGVLGSLVNIARSAPGLGAWSRAAGVSIGPDLSVLCYSNPSYQRSFMLAEYSDPTGFLSRQIGLFIPTLTRSFAMTDNKHNSSAAILPALRLQSGSFQEPAPASTILCVYQGWL